MAAAGEARRHPEDEPLGTLVLEDLPPRTRGDVQIAVSFRIDVDGILYVSATDQASGVRREAHLRVPGAPVEDP
jgi:molecular chaperone DnaK (HSP70)